MRPLLDFKEPKQNQLLIALIKFLFPAYLHYVERLAIKFCKCSVQVRELLNRPSVIICLNHSDRRDPLVAFALARYLHESPYCAVAREVFDWHHGLLGWFFQRLGCYSVNRGGSDIKSILMGKKIVSEAKQKLIIFPEAEVTGDNWTIHELQQSIFHLFLEVQDEMRNKNVRTPIWVLPVAAHFSVAVGWENWINKSLARLERKLNQTCQKQNGIETRTLQLLTALLQILFQHYSLVSMQKGSLHEEVQSLARHICERIDLTLHLECDHSCRIEELLHKVRNDVSTLIDAQGNADNAYRQHLRFDARKAYACHLSDLDRAERLLILSRVLQQASSAIKICRIVDFLEAEILGRMTVKGWQVACVNIGEPVELAQYLALYKDDRTCAIDSLAKDVRGALQSALNIASGKLIASPIERQRR